MVSLLKKQFESLIQLNPLLYKFYLKKRLSFKFKNEIQLINNKSKTDSTHPSILHFSFQKSATQYVKDLLTICAQENNLTPIKLPDYAFNSNFPFLDQLQKDELEQYQYIFRKEGYLYTVFGDMVQHLENLNSYKVIFLTRDPRDILVSEYFSLRYSHPTPSLLSNKNQLFSERQQLAKTLPIDEFVLKDGDRLKLSYDNYNKFLIDKHKNIHLTSYENMMKNFPEWLDKILNYCELTLPPDTKHQLIHNHTHRTPIKENKRSHLRKATPGDYKNKLNPKTIEQLNIKFAETLKLYYNDEP